LEKVAVDLSAQRQDVARALTALEAALVRLIDALAHRPASVCVEGTTRDQPALQRVCEAYSAIDYGMEDAVGTSVVCLGVVGVSAEVLKRAVAVNEAKAALKGVCAPLQHVRTRIPVKGDDGPTKAVPVIRVILRNIQRSDLNLLAAYRKIPILDAPPLSVTYTRACTRAVYRKSIDEIYGLLAPLEGPMAAADRARVETLGRQDKFLAVTRQHYDNVRANIVYARLDKRGRGRMQIGAELPLMYAMGRHPTAPQVNFPVAVADHLDQPRRVRQAALEGEPFLKSIPAYGYARPVPRAR